MKIERRIFLIAVAISTLGWILDVVFCLWDDPQQNLLALIFTPPLHEIGMRIIFIFCVLGFSFIVSRIIKQREKIRNHIESLARFPAENIHPVLRIDTSGNILYANDASETILHEWKCRVGEMAPEFWRQCVDDTFVNRQSTSCDASIGSRTFHFVVVPLPEHGYANLYGSDITARRTAEEALRKAHSALETRVQERTAELIAANLLLQEAESRATATNALLRLFMEKSTRQEYLASAVQLLANWSECHNVGIRVLNDQGLIPYEASVGFSEEFLKKESQLSINTDKCVCIRVVLGSADPQEIGAMSSAGSFNTNDSLGFHKNLTESEKCHYRGECMSIGFASLAIVPVKYQNKTIGAIHLADVQSGKITPRMMEFMEAIALLIGEALHLFKIEEELHHHRHHLEEMVEERSVELKQLNQELQAEIAERKQTEEKLKAAVIELSRSNQELEQFAYVASHDLQEPLRMVASYVTLLSKRYGQKLDADADEFIGYAVDGAHRMQRLIRDLLDFSRVGMGGRPLQPFSIQSALDLAQANLKVIIEETGARVTSDTLPVINGDESQFVQLFQNLIDNALKFRDSQPPHIHISASWKDNSWVISVADNGIGIDPKQYNRIFLIFQRLHGARKYPGTGIGLAICKKIVERHGGRIWVQPGSGKGTIFHFTVV